MTSEAKGLPMLKPGGHGMTMAVGSGALRCRKESS